MSTKLPPPISHLTILKFSGIVAFILPIVLVSGNIIAKNKCELILPALSTYYYSDLGDYFVASLGIIAFCLYAYSGNSALEKQLSNIAAIALLGVAFLPTYVDNDLGGCLQIGEEDEMIGKLHYACAAIFFIAISIFCLFVFPTTKKPLSKRKKKMNLFFRCAGILMILCCILMIVYSIYLDALPKYAHIDRFRPIFCGETICIWLFSISWFLKGNVSFD